MFKKARSKILTLEKLTKIEDLTQKELDEEHKIFEAEVRKEFGDTFEKNMVRFGLGIKKKVKKVPKEVETIKNAKKNDDEEYNFKLKSSENELHEKLGKSIAQRTETTRLEDENALEDSFESLNVSS